MIPCCATSSASAVPFWISSGYAGASEFAQDFPFVPIVHHHAAFCRDSRYGNSGKHLPVVSVPCCLASKRLHRRYRIRQYALVPFFRFYDTVHTFLDSSIRRVIERCEKAADIGAGIESIDVDVLEAPVSDPLCGRYSRQY